MTIGQVAKDAGVTASAIRFYEKQGILNEPQRKNGIRTYDPEAVDRIRAIRFLRNSGLSIAQLRSVFSSAGLGTSESAAMVRRRIAELDGVIDEAHRMQEQLHGLLACCCEGDKDKCIIYAQSWSLRGSRIADRAGR